MPRARDLLNRFRPSGTPGAAGAAGVPADHEAGAAEERAALVARLREHGEAEAAATTAEAERRATEVRTVARARTAGCVDEVVDTVRALLAGPASPGPRDAP